MAENDDPSKPHGIELRWLSTAATLGIALVVALGGMALFTYFDRTQRASLESVSEPTAVGDTRFVPAGESVERPLGKFRGRVLMGDSVKKYDDSRMLRLGDDDTGSFGVYKIGQAKPSKRAQQETDADSYFLKTASGQYIKTSLK